MAMVEPCVSSPGSRPPTFPTSPQGSVTRPATKPSLATTNHSRPPTVPSIILKDDICEDVEEKLKSMAMTKRIRVSEFFKDYDPLRSGYITSTQFRRCMDQQLSMCLTDDEYSRLVCKYSNSSGMFNYKDFSEALEKVFNPNILDGKPENQIQAFQRSARILANADDPSDMESREHHVLLKKCAYYYKSRGITVRSCYQDFDRHNMGYVTLSQFHRSFPGPPELSEVEVGRLAQRYFDPSSGLYNYLKFNNDIRRLWQSQETQERASTASSAATTLSTSRRHAIAMEDILQRIRDATFKHGIRTTEFFCDHDKLRSGLITENQFMCGLSLCCEKSANLTREEIKKVMQHYMTTDGRVKYKEFCDMVENTYNDPNFERKPTATVYRPLRGHLQRIPNALDPSEEEAVETILARLRRTVRQRQLLLYPYFRDFDRNKGYTKGVTKSQFERLLRFLSLEILPQELILIQKKFENPVNGDIDYPAFIQSVDEEYTAQTQETPPQQQHSDSVEKMDSARSLERVDFEELLLQLQEYVSKNRVRVCEHFQDFDHLRSGYISIARFRQCLSSMGQPYLTDGQFNELCRHYQSPERPGMIAWKVFQADIDKVFENMPDQYSSRKATLPPQGVTNITSDSTDQQKDLLDTTLTQLKERVSQRKTLLKPTFRDFDRHNRGHVTVPQFKRCLHYLDLPITDDQIAMLLMKFTDSMGFNYIKFLSHLEPSEVEAPQYGARIAAIASDRKRVEEQEFLKTIPKSDLVDHVMDYIKTKVSKERMRVVEFMRDYDKLRTGFIPLTSFHRAMDLCGFGLTPVHINALQERYCSSKDPTYINYLAFSEDVEAIFTTQELEKMPTLEVHQYIPTDALNTNTLTQQQQQLLDNCLHRIAERVRVCQLQLYAFFEDYDHVHIGSVSKNQFHRVMTELGLGKVLSQQDFDLLCAKFETKVGGRHDINYNKFCSIIEDYAETRWTDPSLQ